MIPTNTQFGKTDLFGNPLDPPKWVEAPLFDPPPVIAVPLEPPPALAAKPKRPRHNKPNRGRPSGAPRRSLKGEVEAELLRLCIPYVCVDEAKKALFAAAKLKSFHFVVYCRTGSNWLLWCGDADRDTRQDMHEWAKVFGDGFRIVYALRRAGGIAYRTAEGEAISLSDCLASEPVNKEQA